MGEVIARVTHGIRRQRAALGSTGTALLLMLVLLIGLLGIVRLALASRIVAEARHLQQMREELNRLYQENNDLELRIARWQYGPELLLRAQEMGFVPAERIERIGP